jgi:hypothetical protein
MFLVASRTTTATGDSIDAVSLSELSSTTANWAWFDELAPVAPVTDIGTDSAPTVHFFKIGTA